MILRNLFQLTVFHDSTVSCGGLLLTKWASTLSLRPTISCRSKLVLKLTGYNPTPALNGLNNPWKGSVQKAGAQKGSYSGLKSMPNGNEERARRAWSWKSNILHPETAKDIMGGCQEYEYVSANQWINANFISASLSDYEIVTSCGCKPKTTLRKWTKVCLHFMAFFLQKSSKQTGNPIGLLLFLNRHIITAVKPWSFSVKQILQPLALHQSCFPPPLLACYHLLL